MDYPGVFPSRKEQMKAMRTTTYLAALTLMAFTLLTAGAKEPDLPKGSVEVKDATFAKWLKDHKLYVARLTDKKVFAGSPRLVNVVDPEGNALLLQEWNSYAERDFAKVMQGKAFEKSVLDLFGKAKLKAGSDDEAKELAYVVMLLVRVQHAAIHAQDGAKPGLSFGVKIPDPLDKANYKVATKDDCRSINDVYIMLRDRLHKVSISFDKQGALEEVKIVGTGAVAG